MSAVAEMKFGGAFWGDIGNFGLKRKGSAQGLVRLVILGVDETYEVDDASWGRLFSWLLGEVEKTLSSV